MQVFLRSVDARAYFASKHRRFPSRLVELGRGGNLTGARNGSLDARLSMHDRPRRTISPHGEQSKLTLNSIMACEGRVYDLARRTPNLTNTSLFRRDQHLCLYCGKSHGERDLTRDHVVPISRGGDDTWRNVVSACRRCNQFKGNKLLHETNMELLALPYTPNHAEYLALINSHRIRADQMEFLRPNFSRQSRLREPTL